jgi:hypothetical protein
MELIERHDLTKIHYLNSLSFKEFKTLCGDSCKNEEDRKIQFNILKEFCKTNIKTRGETKRIYAYSLQTPLITGGRLYCGNSVQSLKSVFRGFLMTHTTDIDMKNCHPVLLRYICKKHNILCPNLESYINNRDIILSQFENKDDAKILFLKSVNDDKHNFKVSNKFFKDFDKEMKYLQDTITSLECYIDIKKSVPDDKKYNWNGSAINRILCMYENKVLQSCISSLNKRNIDICSLMFDGLMTYGSYYDNDELLQYITSYVENEFNGLEMEWAYKPHKNTIVIPDDFVVSEKIEIKLEGVQTDMEATQKLYELYPHWVFCLDILYVFNLDTGMWDSSKTSYLNIIKKFKNELRLIIESKDGLKQSNKSYGDTLVLMEKIPPLIKTLCQNDNWLRENEHTSLGKLLFNNGYINLKEKKFYSKNEYGFNPKIVFMGKIHQDFEIMSESDIEYVEDVKQRLFITPLGNDVGNYFILNLARGLAGDMMKRTLFCLGGTNCGKSIATKAVTLSCGDYVGAFNAENLAYRNSSNDEAQIMRWILLLKYKRLIFSNELKSTVEMNGNMIKKCASGGDPMVGRLHGKEEESFTAHFLSILFANDLPKIKPYDDAVDERLRVIPYDKTFVDEPSNDYELKKDYNIEQEMKTLRFQKAIVTMLINRYFQYLDDNLYIDPKEVIQGKKDWIDMESNYVVTFLKDYEITNDENHYVLSSDVQKWIDDRKLGITITKFAKEFKKYCSINKYGDVMSKNKKIKGKACKCWIGIKEIDECDE